LGNAPRAVVDYPIEDVESEWGSNLGRTKLTTIFPKRSTTFTVVVPMRLLTEPELPTVSTAVMNFNLIKNSLIPEDNLWFGGDVVVPVLIRCTSRAAHEG
jgi:hypothetical protein